MGQFRVLTAGESHGQGLTMIIEGVPAGLPLSEDDIAPDLHRRQGGYGRGGRMKIESDHADIKGGVRHGKTLGSPIALWRACSSMPGSSKQRWPMPRERPTTGRRP